MSFSHSQQVALALTPKFTGILSLIGSFWIAVEVMTQHTKRKNVYNRLLLAMSVSDFITSINYFLSTWPMPSETEGVVYAHGNTHSCVLQGFFIQAGLTSPAYNFCLTIYYLLIVKCNLPEDKMKRSVEPFMHIFAISLGYGPAFAGIPLTLYNEANIWCWIAEYPDSCQADESQCTRGVNGDIYRWAFFFGPLWIIILLVTIIMVVIYRTVTHRQRVSLIELQRVASSKRSSLIVVDNNSERPSIYQGNNLISRIKRRGTLVSFQTNMNNTDLGRSTRRWSMLMPRSMAERMQALAECSNTNTADLNYVLETIETFTSANKQRVDANSMGLSALFNQSLLYTLAFYATWVFATVNRIVQQVTGNTYFTIIFLHVFFVPLQGLFNALIYRRGHYLRLKQRYPHMSQADLLNRTFRWSFLGPPPDRKSSRVVESSKRMREEERPAEQKMQGDSAEVIENGSQGSSVINDEDQEEFLKTLSDDLGMAELDYINDIYSDALELYSEFPNMVSEDFVVVNKDFPNVILEEDAYPSNMDNPEMPSMYPVMTSEQ